MFMSEVVPEVAYGILALHIPRVPRYLVSRGEPERARHVLSQVLRTGIESGSARSAASSSSRPGSPSPTCAAPRSG